MSITSFSFVAFFFVTLLVYYLVPKKLQWCVLLLASCVFYAYSGLSNMIYVLVTASSIYGAARWMQAIADRQRAWLKENKPTATKDEKKAFKNKNKRHRKWIMLAALLLNLGILCAFKYAHFAIDQINGIMRLFSSTQINNSFQWIIPLGISFYTFQSIGYLVDVYWENVDAEHNYFKLLLFVSFFPQMTQGPISDYQTLSVQLTAEHSFTYQNYSHGMQRALWGFFKKMLVADVFGFFFANLSADFETYTGITTLLGIFCYAIQIYADFSGYMDIMCGLCEVLGISLTENFNRPYFSKSVAEYWRRWHISLGEWFKKYIYYPIGMSQWSRKFAKKAQPRFGKHFANTVPATIALLVTWFTTGLWHGANWGYIIWGLVNGAFIIFSIWMEPVYAEVKKRMHIQDNNRLFRLFQVLRTFLLVALIKVLPEVGSLSKGLALIRHAFTDFRVPTGMNDLLAFQFTLNPNTIGETAMGRGFSIIAVLGVVAMLAASLYQRKNHPQNSHKKSLMLLHCAICAVLLILLLSFGVSFTYLYSGGGFLYAGF